MLVEVLDVLGYGRVKVVMVVNEDFVLVGLWVGYVLNDGDRIEIVVLW